MLQQEQVAINEKKGMYADADVESNATVQWHGADSAALLQEHKGKLVPAVVEAVRDGASLRVILKPSLQLVNFGLSGVQCPRLNPPVNAAESEEPVPTGPAPHAREAKHFSEVRLLHRDVELKLEGVDKYGNLFGSVVHPSGRNISVEILRIGLGRMADWSSAFTSASARATMRNAEKEAKQQKLRVWKEYEAPVLQSDKRMTGTVVEVISGDCLVVYVPDAATPAEQEKRIYLSSLRAPRLGNARRGEPNAPLCTLKWSTRSPVLPHRETS
ncbi:nuclease, putative [Phytophthora infestans T30-4]|uniref:Nuclease, putative n=1 Tax=Phytophthora infestans (strain T30-4) TaxID=403677 RepID=D0N0D1_PHYIT|nr:nuclease, putative [Phytophthora infestans T30-4]EEY67094.1 nuclease, putative [Phytophthora infestans T30-4]|eukprot:XP_002905742.1 nuclease, putative [Phytophthora infestans T30-4]